MAGFKSFVDPTLIPVPGQLVGVVGPNGCGKSNVIDAVRWVLGESSARQLRGESMQDVIFNGSSARKPVGRASVELTFDNSLGKAAGQWSQYAEIAVKRVLQRNGDSSYHINNIRVRRRDVTDIFLGTGLGARAYAIIEQGMISRIIEARPEELRVFLEEAAGVSKYKERRRETEARLAGTRENLERVDDIRQELEKQLQHLEAQAEVARRYQELQSGLHTAQNLLWLLKKRDAAASRERFATEIQRLTNGLESETARLRETEKRLEQVRSEHYAAGDALHGLQGDLYAANAEVARLEQQQRHLRENRERLAQQLAAQKARHEQVRGNLEGVHAALAGARNELDQVQLRVVRSKEEVAQERQRLPLAEQALRQRQERVNALQGSLSQSEQAWQIENAHRNHALKTLQQLESRRQRLQQEQVALPRPDHAALEHHRGELAAAEQALAEIQGRLAHLQERLPAAERAKEDADRALQEDIQQLTGIEGRLAALEQMQARLAHDERLQEWLEKYGLEDQARLWQGVQIEPGWEDALENVLGERLNALALDGLDSVLGWLADPPPAQLIAADLGRLGANGQSETPAGLTALRAKVGWKGGQQPALLDEWLRGVYAAEDLAQAWGQRGELAPAAMVVSRQGHILTRDSVIFHGARSGTHGVLARQREIEELREQASRRRASLPQLQDARAQAEQALQRQRSETAELRAGQGESQQRQHRLQMEVLKLTQLEERLAHRREQLIQEIEEIAAQIELESEQRDQSEHTQEEYRAQIEALREHIDDAKQERLEAEDAVNRQRAAAGAAERRAQEAEYQEKASIIKISELENSIKVHGESLADLEERLEALQREQGELDEGSLQQDLQQALERAQEKEGALARARDGLAGLAQSLGELEKGRLALERGLDPMRERIGEMRLKEQEARLAEQQFDEQLRAADADEAALAPLLEKNARPAPLLAEIAGLTGQIAALGAVNLAALEELAAARERKIYLDAQADDLREAIDTLENAIRRIDRETRERLQETYDKVNRHIGEMFPTLFGGGQARLVLTGDEILDAGIQVVAQPPGKKNSSIHLLSGGEKALTALSLVFSLFQLNPAPFCLLDEVDAPLDDTNTERFCDLVKKMSQHTQFLFISHNKITMEMAHQLVGVTMQESGVSRVVAVDIEQALRMHEEATA